VSAISVQRIVSAAGSVTSPGAAADRRHVEAAPVRLAGAGAAE
jgi:hypothetical protein